MNLTHFGSCFETRLLVGKPKRRVCQILVLKIGSNLFPYEKLCFLHHTQISNCLVQFDVHVSNTGTNGSF